MTTTARTTGTDIMTLPTQGAVRFLNQLLYVASATVVMASMKTIMPKVAWYMRIVAGLMSRLKY